MQARLLTARFWWSGPRFLPLPYSSAPTSGRLDGKDMSKGQANRTRRAKPLRHKAEPRA